MLLQSTLPARCLQRYCSYQRVLNSPGEPHRESLTPSLTLSSLLIINSVYVQFSRDLDFTNPRTYAILISRRIGLPGMVLYAYGTSVHVQHCTHPSRSPRCPYLLAILYIPADFNIISVLMTTIMGSVLVLHRCTKYNFN